MVQILPGPPFKSLANKRVFAVLLFSGIAIKTPFCQPFVNFPFRGMRPSHLTGAGGLYLEKASLALKELPVAEEMPCVTAKSRRRSISIRRKTATKRAVQGEFLSAVGINATIN